MAELRVTVQRYVETEPISQIEKNVLVAVLARLDELAREGRWREAAELGAPLPFEF